MDETKIINLIKDQNEENRRHQKMLLEEFNKNNRVIADVQIEQGKKLKNIADKIESIINKQDHYDIKINALLEMVATNTEDLETIKGMLKRKVDIDEFEILVKRVAVLETKIKTF